MPVRSRTIAVLTLCVSLAALVSAGCVGETEGVVTGHVTYRQKPVTSGIVNFYAPAIGAAAQADLDASGSFVLPGGLPAGKYKVAVMPPLPEQLPPGSPLATPKPFDVPATYHDAALTPIERDVASGPNEIAIDIPG